MMQIADLCVIIFTVSFIENALFVGGFAFDGIEKLPTDRKTFLYFVSALLVGTLTAEAIVWTLIRYVFASAPHMSVIISMLTSVGVMIGILYLLSKFLKRVYRILKPYALLLTANTASVGVVFTVTEMELAFADSILYTVLFVFGVTVSYVIFADIYERIYEKRQPKAFRGLPGALIAAGLAAMVFVGISGIDLTAFR